ncbi:MAG: OB-fold nucleic acid binding domain-containing protein, partial [Bacteroidales bacterium]|nr:OB-fold nucleic acid binding domain-containing protein [Bacteroidales bacterium]
TIVGTPSFSETFGNMQYEISSGNVELLVYRGFYFNGAKFTSADQLKEGDVVTVYGKLKKYVNGSNEMTAEIDQDNILVELNGTKHMIAPTVTAEVNNDAKTIKVTWNVVDGASSYDVTCGTLSQTGLTATTYTFTVTENGTYDITVSAKADGLDTVSGTAVAIVGSADWATIYTSNVTLTTEGGTSASAAKVVIDSKEYDAIKAGTGKVAGAVKVTVPEGKTHLHIHAAGWNGENVALSISGATVTPSSLTLTADSGVANNSPFTLVGDASSYYFDLEFSETDAPTTLTFTATSGKRFVIWGVNAE